MLIIHPAQYLGGHDKAAGQMLGSVLLNNDEVAWLSERPQAAHMVRREPRCDLEIGHSGPHAAMGQQGDGVEWWVRWTLSASEVVETMICPAESNEVDEHGEHEVCLLFEGHPGRHVRGFEGRSEAGRSTDRSESGDVSGSPPNRLTTADSGQSVTANE